MAEKPEDDVTGVHDEPNKDESPEERAERHEMLHHEHRGRIDKLMKHCGIQEDGESDDIRSRRRHD